MLGTGPLALPTAGMEVALVVNNLGGTSNLELSIMTNAAIRYLGIQFTPSPFLTGIVAVSSSSSSGCAAGCGGEGVCWQSDDITGNGWSLSHSPEALPRLAPLPRSVPYVLSVYF